MISPEKVVDIVAPYCSKVRRGGGSHYVCYPKGSKYIIPIASSPSDGNYVKHVFQKFKKAGIIIHELEKLVL